MHVESCGLLLLPLLLLGLVEARQPNHFGTTCQMCSCYVEYTDRDMRPHLRPYAMALDPYDSTEDRCLATCQLDEQCKAVVYGLIGGRKVFTCEFYERATEPRFSVQYTPHVNVYLKRYSCNKPFESFPPVVMIDADDSSAKRREKVEKRARAFNPFLGRRR